LKARLPVYPEFLAKAETFLHPAVLAYAGKLSGDDGLVKDGGPLVGRLPTALAPIG
jgi:hypothetical protein